MALPAWLQAGCWGLLGGSALLLGAGIGYFLRVPQRAVAAIMAFGAGVLISAMSFELINEAYERRGLDSTAFGFLAGATVYTAANWYLNHKGAKHRKRSGNHQLSIASGAILAMLADTMIPEAFEQTHDLAGLITVFGFLIAFILSKLGR